MQQLPFVTSNQSLAIALHLAGAELLDVQRLYSLDEEAKFGLRARDCASKNLGGKFQFHIAPREDLQQLIDAYDDAAKKDADETQEDIPPEDAVRIVCAALKVRKQLQDVLRSPGCVRVVKMKGEAVRRESGDTGTLTHPGMIICSDTDAMRADLGIPYKP